MATQHIGQQWDILNEGHEDTSTVDYQYIEYRPQNDNVAGNQNISQFEFNMNDLDAYMLMSKSYVEIRVSISRTAGFPPAAVANADEFSRALQNGLFLFQRGTYLVNNVIIEDIDFLQYAVLTRNLLDYSDDYNRTGGTAENWYRDTTNIAHTASTLVPFTMTHNADWVAFAPAAVVTDAMLTIRGNPAYNLGYVARSAL
jgi:hypothetical protein